MRAGALDRKIVIEVKGLTKDGFGQEKEGWTTLYNVSAQVLPMRGNERFIGDQPMDQADTKFRIRHIAGINPKDHRIFYNGKAYDITGQPMEIGRREGLELHCKARAE